MIQRIQTIYLLISAVLMSLTIAFPFVGFIAEKGYLDISAFTINDPGLVVFTEASSSILTLGVSIIVIAVMNLASIFMFTKRSTQIRFVRYAMLLKVAALGVVGYFTYLITTNAPIDVNATPRIGALITVLAIIIDWFAIRAIKKDENLIKSVDRIR